MYELKFSYEEVKAHVKEYEAADNFIVLNPLLIILMAWMHPITKHEKDPTNCLNPPNLLNCIPFILKQSYDCFRFEKGYLFRIV